MVDVIDRRSKSKATLALKNENDIFLKRSIRKLESREVESVNTSLLSNNYSLNYNSLLNEEQKKALLSTEGQYLVIAGAGSGKTRTIVYRTAWLIENGIKEERILMITFTRKASEEMKSRLKEILKRDEVKVTITTFHSFCARLIRKYENIFKLIDFEIIDEERRKKIFEYLIKKMDLNRKYKDNFYTIDELSEGLNKVQNRKLKVEEVFEKEQLKDDIYKLKSEYKKYKKTNNIYEFDDMIDIVLEKFRDNREFRDYIKNKIDYLIVDEYQDSNISQMELLKELIGDTGNLMVVGDDYQSIYGFRGANFTNILKFGDDFPNSKLIKLKMNYRSSDEIIEYTNRIANKFNLKYNKIIIGTDVHCEKVHKNSFKNIEGEGDYICKKILQLKDKIPLEEIAILYRNRYIIKALEKLLNEYGIEYHKKEEESNGVALYTVHSAKGLEWEVVFIPTLLEGVFPNVIDSENLEEEKRLYYVACSRAKKYLYLSYPRYYYEKLGYFDKRSRFLNY